MSPDGGGQPTGELLAAIERAFGGFDAFKKEFAEKAAGLFGSGWTWLATDADGKLEIMPLAQCRHALEARPRAGVDPRRVGARLLHRLPQRASAVHRDLLDQGQLGLRGQVVCGPDGEVALRRHRGEDSPRRHGGHGGRKPRSGGSQ